jgi:hypothetical protein
VNIDPITLMLYVIVGFALAELRRAFIAHRERVARLLVPQPESEPREIGWCFMTIFGEDTLAYGLASEATISGEPWICVRVPDDADGWRAEVLYPLEDVRTISMADESECRGQACEDADAESVADLPPIGGQAVAEDKPN